MTSSNENYDGIQMEDEPTGQSLASVNPNALIDNRSASANTGGEPIEVIGRSGWTLHEICELLFCFLLFLSGFFISGAGSEPLLRSIPYQELSTGDFALNQIYNQPFEGETVSVIALFLCGIILPFVLQMVLTKYTSDAFYLQTICVYMAAIGITQLVTNMVKNYVGYLRPVFYDLCEPDDEYATCNSEEGIEGRKSFPSGHSSIAFCGLGLLSFFLEWRFGISRYRRSMYADKFVHQKHLSRARIFSLCLKTPLLLATYIATSRIVDNMHHPADVVGGSILGLGVAFWVHNIWFTGY